LALAPPPHCGDDSHSEEQRAKLIALDLPFSEKERNLGLQEIRELQKALQERSGTAPKDPSLLKSLSDIESRLDSDRLLIKAVREGGSSIFH